MYIINLGSLLFFMSFVSFSQSRDTSNFQGKGIRFEENLSWGQMKIKAKNENKFIFVDCFTTWCGPCKQMDKFVYLSDKIGAYIESEFISLKLQIDTTKEDNARTKTMYSTAKDLQKRYNVNAFPTYLFFSPNGDIVHKDIGFKSIEEFTLLLSEVLDTSKQYYTLVNKYNSGVKEYSSMFYLIKESKKLGDNKLVDILSKDYKYNYLDKLSEDNICTKKNLEFINEFASNLVTSKDKFFVLCYLQPDKVNNIVHNDKFSQMHVENIITNEELEPALRSGGNLSDRKINWQKLAIEISNKYPRADVNRIILKKQLSYYRLIESWGEYAKYVDKFIEITKPTPKGTKINDFGDAWGLNDYAWDVFLHCMDKPVLLKALQWSELSIKLDQPNPNLQYLDTRANILYKLGRVKDAIIYEEQVLKLDLDNAKKEGKNIGFFTEDYKNNISNMKSGKPTWKVLTKMLTKDND